MADYDVIVVGSGVAGLAAALGAANQGASTLVVEAGTVVGGSSRLSGGHFYAAGTSIQRANGVQDSADAMFEHYMTLNQWLVEPSVVRRFCDLSAPTFEWLLELGVRFPESGLYPSGVGSTPRGHQPEGGGEAVVQTLEAHCAQAGVDVVLDARVSELTTNDLGITGVRIAEDRATAHAVVMAAGGFGANQQMWQEHFPDAAATGNWGWYIGCDTVRGDAITLGTRVGAALDGHNRGLLLVTPGFSRDLEVLLPNWLILVNGEGRRFGNESAPYTVLSGLLQNQPQPIYAVFDETARNAAKPSATSQAYWVNDVLAAKAQDGTILQAGTLTDLARKMECDAEILQGTINRYNSDVRDHGEDRNYFKPLSSTATAIADPPFYAAEVRPAIVCWTGKGLRINSDCEVLDRAEQKIPGLYAAGECVGSLHGDRYIGGGGSFGPGVVFGKLAGINAAARSKRLSTTST